MLFEPDWIVFKQNFPDDTEKHFENFCYMLFCNEFDCKKGITTYENQTALETIPIIRDNDVIGFQAKFYDVPLTSRVPALKETIKKAKEKYSYLTKIVFYLNKNWTESHKNNVEKTEKQIELENYAKQFNITLDFRTEKYFFAPEVIEKNASIYFHYFSPETELYYGKLKQKIPENIFISTEDKYKTTLYIDSDIQIINYFSLFEYINTLLKEKDITVFPNVYIKGVAGVSKTLELKYSYNKLIKLLAQKSSYGIYRFLPVPYFFDLKNYQEGCLLAINDKIPLLFLDGLDEIPNSKILVFIKELHNCLSKNSFFRFVIAGRDAAFIKEIKEFSFQDTKLQPYIDSEVQSLMWHYKGTPLESLVSIPFYRNFAASHKENHFRTYKDFIGTLITERLKEDKNKRDRSNNISTRNNKQSTISKDVLNQHISEFCYKLFKENIQIFSQEVLISFFQNEEELDFLVKSSLINYQNENEISFFSNIYFEYYLAYYFSNKKFSVIQKEFFLTNKKINVRYVNIISILLNIMDINSSAYKELTSVLEKENICYILLTDFDKLNSEKRYEWYTKILSHYNSNKKLIYYARFVGSYDLLANIDSLSDKLNDLLPEEFQANAIDMHLNFINHFLENPTEEKLREFSNYVVLLGVNDRKIWNTVNSPKLKAISISLIKFFLFNPLAKKIKSILSARCIFNWYGIYNWINDWKLEDWQTFIKSIYPQTSEDFYSIKDFIDHEIKMTLFIYLYKNIYIWKLYVSLSNYMLSNSRSFVPSSTPVPGEIDDDYTVKTINIGGDDYFLTAIIKQEKIDLDGILEIFKTFSAEKINLYNLGFEAQELLNEIKSQFKLLIPTLTTTNVNDLYEIGLNYLNFEKGLHLNNLDEFIKLFSNEIKQKLCEKLINDFDVKRFCISWNIPRTLCFLLDLSDEKIAHGYLEKLNNTDTIEIYKNIIGFLKEDSFAQHTLHSFAVQEFPKLFPQEVERHNKHNARIEELKQSLNSMAENEANIILNESEILKTIENIFKYLDENPNFREEKTEKGKLISLRPDYIIDNVTYDFNNEYEIPPIFSEFIVKMLVNEAFNDPSEKVNRIKFEEYIKDAFSNEKYFWRFFFYHFIESYKTEQTIQFLEKNSVVDQKIRKSMELEISELIDKQDLSFYDGGGNRYWVYPFVWYISNLYNNVLPEWFNKEALLNFVAFPAWALGSGIGVHSGDIFNWQSWNSVFEWIQSVSNYSESKLIEYAIRIYPNLKYDQSKTQIISYLIEKLDSYSQFKEKITNLIAQESIIESNKDYESANKLSILNCNILQAFWNKNTDFSYIPKIIDEIPYEKYSDNDANYTRTAIIEFICRLANIEQCKTLIRIIKKNKRQNQNSKTILLAKLGDEKSIISLIDNYLSGGAYSDSIFYGSNAFGSKNPSNKLLRKYIKLFKYSTVKNCERRNNLQTLSINAIKNAANKKNYKIIQKSINKIISEKTSSNEYIEFYEDILNEIEQKVFSITKEGK